jgi:hypothetical protein
MKDPGYYLVKNDFDVDSAIENFVSDLNNEVHNELRNQIDNIINARDLTEEEQELYNSWLISQAEHTGERLF